ncbi:N-carbamoyl-L-amino-acid hydrolase [Salsuginibacillus halophilus]|uniref:N-carbamoyl-L-amino-acid hydrolase n=1 Tax=Salsuginibacillus halophilus TaxID=517424 RepID=A0A2P8HW87_9BACI|nr:M20 family metallo-hydrolase [Salsuginibacillus halophilus]PSL50434.1 N-carbamoyl-L-amino-acid hydrolase [Salsuginibacillus halophilus]
MQDWLNEKLQMLNVTEDMAKETEGFNRLSYTEEEWEAIDAFQSIAESLGMHVRMDEAGNRIARWTPEGAAGAAVAVGSHVDTVESGGGYDGVVGVLAGLGAVKILQDEKVQPSRPVEVICFASEESARFGVSTVGSKAMIGAEELLAQKDVKDKNGVSIEEAVEARGLSFAEILKAERSRDELHSFIELHIEQGMRIERAEAQIGVVTAIACPTRLKLTIQGEAGHTGTAPMAERKDALAAAAEVIQYVEAEGRRQSEKSHPPVVATASTIQALPNVMNVIPGTVELGVDIRSVDNDKKKEAAQHIFEFCQMLAHKRGITVEQSVLVDNPAVPLDDHVRNALQSSVEACGFKPYVMESGAGHDVMNMAKKVPSGLIFIPCKDGVSHHPAELASVKDIERGTRVLAGYLKNVQ